MNGIPKWVNTVRSRLLALLFGDRYGLTLFLGTVCFYMLYWRVDIFIIDTYTIANTMVSVAQGHLYVDPVLYGPKSGVMPGMNNVDGQLYGRNYGHVFLSLPVLWLFQGVALVADPRIFIAAAWSGLLLAFARSLGSLIGRRETLTYVGSGIALLAFGANVVTAQTLPERLFPLVALQVTTIIGTAFIGVVMYRLLLRIHGEHVARIAGVAVAVIGPVGFWAVIPKRHGLMALFAVSTLYCFYRSRIATQHSAERNFRGLSYVFVGLSAWIHAPEAAILLAVLVPLDLATASENSYRTLAWLAAVSFAAFVPFFLTNTLISGNPIRPPRLLPRHTGIIETAAAPDPVAIEGATESTTESVEAAAAPQRPTASAKVREFRKGLDRFIAFFVSGLAALTDVGELYHTYLRSGRIPSVDYSQLDGETVEMTLLESAPILGILVGVVNLHWRRSRGADIVTSLRNSPVTQTDLFAVCYALLINLFYLSRLPLHAMITVRYLIPSVPFLLYLVFRLRPVRTAVIRERTTLWLSCLTTVLLTLALGYITVLVYNPSVGEMMQIHAITSLAAAILAGGWAVMSTDSSDKQRIGGILLGVTVGVTGSFLLLSGILYFSSSRHYALGIIQALARSVWHV